MYPSEADRNLHLSSSPKDQPLLTLRFPKKLWRIVNECRSGAIAWSSDGTAVVIDYPKFQSDYLDNRLDIFKTNNITSFIRQLNLYGFRKVSPYYKVGPHYKIPMASSKHADVHVFRNDSFVRGRPDLLSGVARKTGALRARIMHRKGGPGSSASAPNPSRSLLERARMMHCQGRYLTSRHRQRALRRALEKQREALSRMQRHPSFQSTPSTPSSSAEAGPSRMMPDNYSGTYWNGTTWCSHDSSSDTTSSDEEHEYAYPKTDNANAAINNLRGMGRVTTPSISSHVAGWPMDCAPGLHMTADVSQQATSSGSSSVATTISSGSSPSPSSSACGDMVALLDPSTSPKVVLLQKGREDEGNSTPPLEDSFMLGSLINNIGESLSDDLYYILMTDDENSTAKNSVSVTADGPQHTAAALSTGLSQMKELQSLALDSETSEDDCSVFSSGTKSSSASPQPSPGAYYCI
ncbi:heat shock factor protein-like [Ixodes scapularis]|uniref:Heat shock transcription factor, putative n=1 Tax=Ixodes scapularis TaxID=6945 RepID=B7PT70_IXOSC|nr:heat shock factor protein-like [Ixodes scapularis]EEC09792.1 heat shock transcription factor, putative [Ixodes scapularis]|eukprot:XP_002403944.1 heat shock transcription factor, putative [Ixodes scapularis]